MTRKAKQTIAQKLYALADAIEVIFGQAHIKNQEYVKDVPSWQASRNQCFTKLPMAIATIRGAAKEAETQNKLIDVKANS